MSGICIVEVGASGWERYRQMRLASLESDAYAFGGSLEKELVLSEEEWRAKIALMTPLIALLDGSDVGVMTIENLEGDLGTTCWIGGCWVAPGLRGKGVMRAFIEYIDHHGVERRWTKQGLGVWNDNHSAIKAYQALGFKIQGKPQESTRVLGKFYQRMFRES